MKCARFHGCCITSNNEFEIYEPKRGEKGRYHLSPFLNEYNNIQYITHFHLFIYLFIFLYKGEEIVKSEFQR